MMKTLILFLFSLGLSLSYAQCIEGDCENGSGTYKFTNGALYVGQFKKGKMHGKGKITYPSESGNSYATEATYEGSWKKGTRNGKGTYNYSNGDIYTGGYKDGNMHGKGKYTWHQSGTVYEGSYKDDKRTGKGKLTFKDGTIEDGIFKDDEFIKGSIINPDGSRSKYSR